MKCIVALILSAGMAAGCAAPGHESLAGSTLPPAPDDIVPAIPAGPSMSVGELEAKGGKQLTAQEVKKLLSGATIEGASGASTWRARQSAEGQVRGWSFMNHGGHPMTYQGNWWVDDEGRNCWANQRSGGTPPECMYFYVLGGGFFSSPSNSTNKAAPLYERRISR
jgi:hypothetical protein